jgi:hypothetical protein
MMDETETASAVAALETAVENISASQFSNPMITNLEGADNSIVNISNMNSKSITLQNNNIACKTICNLNTIGGVKQFTNISEVDIRATDLNNNLQLIGYEIWTAPFDITTTNHASEYGIFSIKENSITPELRFLVGSDDITTIYGKGLNVNRINGLSPTGGKYSQTSGDITIADTTAVTSIIGTGQGSLTWAANTIQIGDNYHLKCSGLLESDGKGHELELVIALSGVTIHTTTFIELDDVKSVFPWELELDVMFRSVGASAQLVSNAQFTYNKDDGKDDYRGNSSNDDAVINTEVSQTLTATVQWAETGSDNLFVIRQLVLTKTY